jgi:hypothetical protein
MILFSIILILIFLHILYRLKKIEKKLDDLKDWLFDSLYTIDQRVKTPEEKPEIKQTSKKAKVFRPNEKNGLDEFDGSRDDFH